MLLGFIAFCFQSYAYPPVSIIYVKQNASGANNGTSWTDAYTSLQTAITNASTGTQIWVAAGTYKPTAGTDRGISFSLKNGVAIYGGFPNTGNPTFDDRNWSTNVSILSGDIGTVGDRTDNSNRIIFNSNVNSTAILDGFTISDAYNTSTFNGTGGGGMRNEYSSPTVSNCIFRNNYVGQSGGGVLDFSSTTTYTHCLFIVNEVGYFGGGSRCEIDVADNPSAPTFINCVFWGNKAGLYGGAVGNNRLKSNTILKNCIVWGNTSSDNSIIYNNQGGTTTATYSLIQVAYTGTGNINADPLFVDAANGNFRLQKCSPAVNAGEDAANSTTVDLEKNSRKVGVIDMGAYEYQSTVEIPTAYTVSGGGSLCQGGTGVEITLSGSQSGVNYQLKKDNANVGNTVAGTGNAISFGNQTAAGTYTVVATNASTSCTKDMTSSASVTVNDLPTAYNVGGGGSFCQGGTGVEITLSGSQSGVNYQLKKDNANVGNTVAGTGNAISFGNQTAAGTYTVVATNASTSCTNDMTSSASVTVNDLPTAYNVGGGGSFCQGGIGVEITLSGSQSGVNYQLKKDNANVGNTVAGTGNAISFGNQTAAGTYTVVATNASTSCTKDMTSSASVIVNDLPTAYNVGGGGSFCQGGTGVEITLSGSQSGVNYQLKKDNANVGNVVAGTGNAISFGNQTAAGTYTVVATNASTSCTKDMTSSASVIANAYPIAFTVGGGGSICTTEGGNLPSTSILLSSSESHVSYQLFHNNSPVGTPKNGTGNIIVFTGIQQSGNYTIEASIQGSCVATMNSSANVIIGITPSTFSLTGGGSYCKGGAGVNIGLSGSQEGFVYQLRRSNSNIGSPVAGTGNAILFGNQTLAGTYTVVATQATTSCNRTMTGSKTVSIANCNARIASAEEVSLDDWAVVAPNPVGRHISVKLVDVANQKVEFQLLSMTGQTLLSHHIYATIPNLTENLDITTLKSGIYLLNVKTRLKTTTIKVVKPE